MKHFKFIPLKILCVMALCLALAGCSAGTGGLTSVFGALRDTASEYASKYLAESDSGNSADAVTGDGTRSGAPNEDMTKPSGTAGIDENRTPASLTAAASTVSLPSRYDSREHGSAAPVRDQQNLGTCWAFASLSALESRLLPGESWDFSEDHMSHDPYFLLGQTGGGEYTMAMAYLLSWRGPVTEAEDPYGDQISPSGLSPSKHVQEILILPDNDAEAVKRAVMDYGSVETSVYMDMKYINERSDFYNPDTAAYCCTLPFSPNHDITIIGWDDDFPKEAFTQPVMRNGAYICENNWGTEFGEDGFFYVSYEDRTIGADNIVYSVVEPVTNYSEIFQCDACGWIGQMGYGEESAWAANVYQTDRNLELAAAGFYAIDRNTEYEVYVARNISQNPTDADFENRVKVAAGKLTYSGYYTIPFDKNIPLNSGERFAVIIHITTPGAIHPIAIEYNAGDGKSVMLLDGESYASYNGEFWERTQDSQECDICLKAYAK